MNYNNLRCLGTMIWGKNIRERPSRNHQLSITSILTNSNTVPILALRAVSKKLLQTPCASQYTYSIKVGRLLECSPGQLRIVIV